MRGWTSGSEYAKLWGQQGIYRGVGCRVAQQVNWWSYKVQLTILFAHPSTCRGGGKGRGDGTEMEKVSALSVPDIKMKSRLRASALTISPDTKHSRHTKCIYWVFKTDTTCVTPVSQAAGQTGLMGLKCYYHQSLCIILLKVKQHFTSYQGVCPLSVSPHPSRLPAPVFQEANIKINLTRGSSLSQYFSTSPNFVSTIL